jgi:N-hydroxyarylamine O-acetyltransferase
MSPHELDLDAYMTRIGLPAAGPPTLALLQAVVIRHATTIPFENLDIILGRPIRLDIGSIQAKLVGASRGGYCFEQNTLLRAALQQLGFTVTSLMARVVLGAPADAITPRTHMLLRIDLPDGSYLADVGFGNLTPTAPLMLGRGDPQPTSHEDYRLQPMSGETLLQARLGTKWQNLYRFADEPSHPIDHEVGNWFTSTKPNDLFTANVIAARPGAKRRVTLFNGTVTTRHTGSPPQRQTPTTQDALRSTLRGDFGIDLNPDELATIYPAAQRFGERAEPGFGLD